MLCLRDNLPVRSGPRRLGLRSAAQALYADFELLLRRILDQKLHEPISLHLANTLLLEASGQSCRALLLCSPFAVSLL